MRQRETTCPGCGAALQAADAVCPFCGHRLDQPDPGRPTPPEVPAPAPAPAAAEPREEARVAPPEPAAMEAVGTHLPPWESRAGSGFWLGLWLTWRDSVFRPVPFFRRLPPRGGIGPALGYVFLFLVISAVAGWYWGAVEAALAGASGTALAPRPADLLGFLLSLAILLPVYLGLLFVSVALLHLGYRIVGAGRGGFEGTFRAVAYCHGPAAFTLFPFFGSSVALIWSSVLVFIGTREIHRTSNGRAALAFLVPAVAGALLVFVLAVVVALVIEVSGLPLPD